MPILLRYHEIALKGANRGWFEEKLTRNAKKLIEAELGKKVHVEKKRGRVLVHEEWSDASTQALSRVFGVSGFGPIRVVPTSLESLTEACIEEVEKRIAENGMPATFRVATKRSEKALPEKSAEIDRIIGGAIASRYPEIKVDLEKPEMRVGVELRFDKSYIFLRKIAGPGGLPVGSNGPLLTLLSGGLDSPIAALQVLKRGSRTDFLHFSGEPFVGPEALEKVEDLMRIVNRYQPDPGKLFVVPFGKIQEKVALATSSKLRTVLYRRLMMRIASRIAERSGALALVTGESLGQVASQTVENLSVINEAAFKAVIRPLVTLDKEEIIVMARKFGTFDASTRPAADCCTLFADRHPAIYATREQVEEQEKLFPFDEFVEEAVQGTERRTLR